MYGWYTRIVNAMEISAKMMGDGGGGRGVGPHMGPYGPIWGPYGPIWAHMDPAWAHMGSKWANWAHIGPKWAPNEAIGAQTLPKDPQKANKKQRGKMTPKRNQTYIRRPPLRPNTCLSKGTGSAFKGWALQKHVLKCCSSCSNQKEQRNTKKGEYKHH